MMAKHKKNARVTIEKHYGSHIKGQVPVRVAASLDYGRLSTPTLRQLAGDRRIPNHRKLPRDELLRALKATDPVP